MKNLYLEKLKRMTLDKLLDECEMHGRKMEQPVMMKEEKFRALLCFKYALTKKEIAEEDQAMLRTAIRILRIL